jgi:predicted GNAT superfamily acetyltransferase
MKATSLVDDAGLGAAAPVSDRIELRPLRSQADYAACVRMQEEVWGDGYGELVPPIILQIAQKVGGVAAGAFDASGQMLGFVFGISGVERGRLVHWSHILAVQPGLRDSGLGRRLKEYQRDQLVPLGVERIYWTFDPLVARNAHLNLNRLGAEVVEYVVDMYGSTGSALHALGTDRLVVAWRIGEADNGGLGRPEVVGEPAEAPLVNLDSAGEPVSASAPLPTGPVVRIAVPSDLERILREAPELARRWQVTVQRSFLHYLGAGYRVSGFDRAGEAGRCYYLLAAPGDSPRDDAGSGPGKLGIPTLRQDV